MILTAYSRFVLSRAFPDAKLLITDGGTCASPANLSLASGGQVIWRKTSTNEGLLIKTDASRSVTLFISDRAFFTDSTDFSRALRKVGGA